MSYMPPEVLMDRYEVCGPKLDIWAAGILFAGMFLISYAGAVAVEGYISNFINILDLMTGAPFINANGVEDGEIDLVK